MKILILYDKDGFNVDDENVMEAIGALEQVQPGNCSLNFGVRRERGDVVPTLYFSGEADEQDFFDSVTNKGDMQVFVAMPQNKLSHFNNQVFVDKKRIYKISCVINNPPTEDLDMYLFRWVTFKRYTEGPQELNLKTYVDYSDKTEEDTYPAYQNPLIVDTDRAGIHTLYHNFFFERKRFPFALPLSTISEEKNYFGTFHNIPKYKLRNSIKEYLKSDLADSNCLFFELWEMTDNPVYAEYLKEGAYFSLNSHNPSVNFEDKSGGIELNGKLQIKLNLPVNQNPVAKWRTELLKTDDLNTDCISINKIKHALSDDVKRGLVGLNSGIYFDQKPLEKSWDVMNTGVYNTNTPRTYEGPWTNIQKIIKSWVAGEIKNSRELQDLLTGSVLDPSASQGSVHPDHNLALALLCDTICKLPFGEIQFNSKIKQKANLTECHSVWQRFTYDFLQGIVGKSIKDLGEITSEANSITYHENLSTEKIFYLRLANKSNDYIKSNFTSILDYPNALNSNFII